MTTVITNYMRDLSKALEKPAHGLLRFACLFSEFIRDV
jgi:hypothetical protein